MMINIILPTSCKKFAGQSELCRLSYAILEGDQDAYLIYNDVLEEYNIKLPRYITDKSQDILHIDNHVFINTEYNLPYAIHFDNANNLCKWKDIAACWPIRIATCIVNNYSLDCKHYIDERRKELCG